MKSNTLLFFLLLFFVHAIKAQSPGGISVSNTMWLRADVGVTNTSNIVSVWNEVSGANVTGNFTVQSLIGTANPQTGPSLIDAGINFNPYIRFNGSNNSLSSINLFSGTSLVSNNQSTIFQVLNVKGGIVWLKWETDQLGSTARLGFENSGGRIRFDFPKAVPASAGQNIGITNVLNKHTLSTCVADGTTSVNKINGATDNTINISAPGNFAAVSDKIVIGNENLLNLPAQVDMAEVVIYSRALTATERNRIESYLAVKYGFTLDQSAIYANNYTASDGTVIWDRAANTGYAANITGIGRDDASGLSQKQSKSILTNALITLYHSVYPGGNFPLLNATNNNPFAGDRSFLLIGDNAAATLVDQCIYNGKGKRMQRVWKASVSGQPFTTTISADQASMPATVKNIIVSPDPGFPAASTTIYPLNSSNGRWYRDINLNHNDYFSFATDTIIVTMSATGPSCTNPNSGSVATVITGNSQVPPVYSWAPSGQTTADLINVAAGTYTLTITQGSCQYAQAITLQAPVLNNPPQLNGIAVCRGNAATVSVQNPPAGYSYNWYAASTGGTALATGASVTIPAVNSDTTLFVEAVNGSCTSVRTPVTVSIILVTAATAPDEIICPGTSATLAVLNPLAGYLYNWYASSGGGTVLSTGTTFTSPVLTAGTTYYVEAELTSCRSALTPVIVSINIVPPPQLSPVEVCEGDAATLSIDNPSPAQTYSWYASSSGGPALGSATSFTTIPITAPVTYYAESNDGQCSSIRVAVDVTLSPVLDSPRVTGTALSTSSIVFSWQPVSGAVGYDISIDGGAYFSPGNGPNILSYTVTGLTLTQTVQIAVRAIGPPQGCGNSLPGYASATTFGEGFYVPTAFTPNGDNLNEMLKPMLPGGSVLDYFTIYNRWGQKIYTLTQAGNGWDGKLKGILQPTGTYVWICRYSFRGAVIQQKGHFTLFY